MVTSKKFTVHTRTATENKFTFLLLAVLWWSPQTLLSTPLQRFIAGSPSCCQQMFNDVYKPYSPYSSSNSKQVHFLAVSGCLMMSTNPTVHTPPALQSRFTFLLSAHVWWFPQTLLSIFFQQFKAGSPPCCQQSDVNKSYSVYPSSNHLTQELHFYLVLSKLKCYNPHSVMDAGKSQEKENYSYVICM